MSMMEKKDLIKKCAAGVFFVVGIVAIFVVILTIGKNKGFAQSKSQVVVLFRNVGGLLEGAPTRLSGVNIGSVAEVDFLKQEVQGRRIKVTLNIYNKFWSQLNKSVRFAIKTEGVLGEKLIEIDVNDHGEPVDLTQPIIGEDPLDVQDLALTFTKAAESFTKTSEEMSKIDMYELSEIIADSSRSISEVSKGFTKVMDDLEDIAIKSKRLLDRIEQKLIEGDLFKVF